VSLLVFFFFLLVRLSPRGVVLVAQVDVKPDNATLTRWTEALGMRKRNVERDSVLLKEIREKMVQALQMIKSLEIREKKRMADALEKKAKEAQEKADRAETEGGSGGATPGDPAVA